MQTKLLKEVVGEIVGKQGTEIVNLLAGKKNVNEFLIAKKLKLTINQTRNILYKLSANNLVSFIRKKDKRKGWYIYFWTLNIEKSLELLEKIIKKEIENLQSQLKSRQNKRFYICKTCNIEVSEETALLSEFACKECGQVYDLAESEKIIKELEIKIKKLMKKLELIKKESAIIKQKEQKKRERKAAREKKKKQKRKKAAAKRKKQKKKAKKKKKKAVKKPKKKKARKR